jgi:propionyl-CoA carboxylase alpha chain
MEKIIRAALDTGCQAVHPGYGFLSENPVFAEKVTGAGLVFIGPSPSAMRLLGDKIGAKDVARAAGVPVVPGSPGALADPEDAFALAAQIGYPVLLKPAAGGGGRGMRVVERPEDLAQAFRVCQDETRKAFADDSIFMERRVLSPRHIEMQIFADSHGNTVWLGERECSIQRRHQKIIEECPSVALTAETRENMGRMAVALAQKAGYQNAGTVEFLFAPDGSYYFLEMNARIQVEYPVTEMVTGLDLLALQIRVAAGEPLPFRQEDIRRTGWAIEARICAEDPARRFLPSTGLVTRHSAPRGKNIRVDSGVAAGSYIAMFYDSMLAKVCAWGENREDARKRLVDALNGYHVEGPVTNVDFANAVLNHPAFVAGDLSTDFIERHTADGKVLGESSQETLHYMALAATLVRHARQSLIRDSLIPMASHLGQAVTQQEESRYVVTADDTVLRVRLSADSAPNSWVAHVNDCRYEVVTPEWEFYRRRLKLRINGSWLRFRLQYQAMSSIWAAHNGVTRTFSIYRPREWELARHMPKADRKVPENILMCPMPGIILDVRARPGDRVYRGQELVIIESMKMESGVSALADGEVDEVFAVKGQIAETGDRLMTFKM